MMPIKEDFIYLDNASTTWPKPEGVYQAVAEAMRKLGANPGRASHRMAREAEQMVETARQEIAAFIHASDPARVIFTLNCTDSLNITLKGLVKPGSRVVIGPYEHNSVTRPLFRLQRSGAILTVVRGTADFGIDLDHLKELCSYGVDVGVFAHASNVTGAILPIRQIAEIVHKHGGIMVIDAAQTAGAVPIDIPQLGCDIVVASGHKGFLGTMGVGVLVLGSDLPVAPFREGGTGFKSELDEMPDELPWRLEAGTPNVPGIAGLLAGLRFIQSVGVDKIGQHESRLAASLAVGLKTIAGVRVLSNPGQPLTGVVSFTFGRPDVVQTGYTFDQVYGIGLRAGLHCSPTAHRALGTWPWGALRASFGYFNDDSHVQRLLAAVAEMAYQ